MDLGLLLSITLTDAEVDSLHARRKRLAQELEVLNAGKKVAEKRRDFNTARGFKPEIEQLNRDLKAIALVDAVLGSSAVPGPIPSWPAELEPELRAVLTPLFYDEELK